MKAEIIEHLKALHKVGGPLTFTDEAEDFHREVYESGKITKDVVNKDHRLETYYGRKNVHLLKMSMIMHFADQTESYCIEKSTVERALRFLAHTEARMHEAYITSGRNILAETQRRLMQYIIDAKGPVKYKKLWVAFIDDLNKDELNQCLEFLLATNQIKRTGDAFVALVDEPATACNYL